MDMSVIEDRKARARGWFEQLRNDICAAFEKLEDDAPALLYPGDAGRFARTRWDRTDHTGQPGGGGVMSVMRGRLFEKACTARPCMANSRPNSAPRFRVPPRIRASGRRAFR